MRLEIAVLNDSENSLPSKEKKIIEKNEKQINKTFFSLLVKNRNFEDLY